MGESTIAHIISAGKLEGSRQLRGRRRACDNNAKFMCHWDMQARTGSIWLWIGTLHGEDILWHVDPLLGNDREISSYARAVAM
jgi:hypothetical protein